MLKNESQKGIKLILLSVLGLLVGLVLHGLIEIPALWLLRTRFSDLFFQVPWSSWLNIHLTFTIVMEIVGVALTFLVYKKFIDKSPKYLLEALIIALFASSFIIIIYSLFTCPCLK